MRASIITLLVSLATPFALHGGCSTDFSSDDTSDFDVIGTIPDNYATYSPTAGVSGGGVSLGTDTLQYWVCKTGQSFTVGGSYTVTTCIRFYSGASIGFATANDGVGNVIYSDSSCTPFSSLTIERDASSQFPYLVDSEGNYTFDSSNWTTTTTVDSNTVNSACSDGTWLIMSATLTRDSTNGYTVEYSTKDYEGGTLLSSGKFSFTGTSNDLVGDSVYAYVALSNSGAAFDNFSFGTDAVPEPADFAMFGGLGALGLLLFRRKSR